MNTIYARKLTAKEEIPRQPPAPNYQLPVPPCLADKGDVAFYSDKAGTQFIAVNPWGFSTRRKTATLNSIRYKLEWMAQQTAKVA